MVRSAFEWSAPSPCGGLSCYPLPFGLLVALRTASTVSSRVIPSLTTRAASSRRWSSSLSLANFVASRCGNRPRVHLLAQIGGKLEERKRLADRAGTHVQFLRRPPVGGHELPVCGRGLNRQELLAQQVLDKLLLENLPPGSTRRR